MADQQYIPLLHSRRKGRHRGRARLSPKFDADGLIPAIVTDAETGEALMFALMNAEALASPSRRDRPLLESLAPRAVEEGQGKRQHLNVVEMRTDCDQDVVWMRVTVEGDGLACHTGRRSCFYRSIRSRALRMPQCRSSRAAHPRKP